MMHMARTSLRFHQRFPSKRNREGNQGRRPTRRQHDGLMEGLEGVRERRVREGPLEVVTLLVETSTPRRRTLSESYEHACTPFGELPLARRARLKKSSGARSRAMLRLQPARHAQHLGERKQKRKTAPKTMRDVGQQRACHVESDWQRHEVERQITVRTTGERPLNSLHSISHAQFLTHRS